MSLKQELQVWADALEAFDKQDFDAALSLFEQIADTSRIFFNLGLIHATLGRHEEAVAFFDQAVTLDPFLAVAFFQMGVSQFLLGRYVEARKDFDEAFLYLRGNDMIEYEQLGLKFKLYSCEILFNRGLSSIYLDRAEDGFRDLAVAQREKRSQVHGVIDEALADRGQGYTVFSVPVGVLFRPPETKLKNLETKDYLGRAKVVAASDANDLFVGFSGTRKLEASVAGARSDSGSSGLNPSPQPLSRSQTSAGRLEQSGDGVASPLRSRAGLAALGGLRRSKTADAAISSSLPFTDRSLTASPQSLPTRLQLPTPPSSDDQTMPEPRNGLLAPPAPQRPLVRSSSARKTYGLASSRDFIDDYYGSPDEGIDSSVVLPVPTAPTLPLNPSQRWPQPAPTPGPPLPPPKSGEYDRVATWAQQNALPSNPRNPQANGSASLSRADSAASSASSHGGGRIAFAPSTRLGPLNSISGNERLRQNLAPSPAPGRMTSLRRQVSQRDVQQQQQFHGPSPREYDSGLEGVGYGMLNLGVGDGGGREEAGYEVLVGANSGAALNGAAGVGATMLQRSASQLSFGMSAGGSAREEMVKVRIKLRYNGDARGMSITPDMTLAVFAERVRTKFSSKTDLPMKYKDSDDALISILDEDDWESAMDQAREAADGRPEGKLEILLGAA
ncbi:hypothetical protein JCM8097_003365 [Rhodosporidiobolus ruineniae]